MRSATGGMGNAVVESMANVTKEKLETIITTVRAEYAKEIGAMQKSKDRPFGFTKKQIGDFEAGHADGVRGIVMALRCAGIIVVDE